MPWKTMDVNQQRVEFVIAAKRGSQPFCSLCEEFGISRPTGYLWLHRYEQLGIQGIVERGRRPLVSPCRTAADLQQRVVELCGIRRRKEKSSASTARCSGHCVTKEFRKTTADLLADLKFGHYGPWGAAQCLLTTWVVEFG